jgi:hypothetical protein
MKKTAGKAALHEAESLPTGSVLSQAIETLEKMGLVGERKNACILYLSMTSRLLERPVNVLVAGPSSAGKSFLVEKVASLFPSEAIHWLTASSPLALLYTKENFAHRVVIVGEAAGLQHDGPGASIIRALVWEGRLVYETVEKTHKGMKPLRIDKPGPTGLITTTTGTVEPELETRMLTLNVRDDPDHSRAILKATARRAAGKQPNIDLAPFHAFQRELALSDVQDPVVPFAGALAQLVDAGAVRVRRDFKQLLTLIKTHALLSPRQKDVDGRVIATLGDYRVIYKLTADLFKATASDGLTPAQRDAVNAVREMASPENGGDMAASIKKAMSVAEKGITLQQVAKALGIDRSSAYRRLRNPLKLGYVVNLEKQKGHTPMRLLPGDPLPKDHPALPSPEELAHAMEHPNPPEYHIN